MQYSPKLKKAAKEIEDVLKKHDIAGLIILHSPGFGELVLKISPSYSCAFIEGNKLRVKAKLNEDFNGDKNKWEQKVKDTTNMLSIISNIVDEIGGSIKEISSMVDKTVNAEHNDKGFTSQSTQNN